MNRLSLLAILWSLWACGREAPPPPPQNKTLAAVETKRMALPADSMPVFRSRFDYDTTRWLDLADLDPTILLDIRYATTNNFVIQKMYDCPRCLLRPEVARAIVRAHRELQKKGLGLKMFDCYRPRPVQQKLWDKLPDPHYVANPKKGSMHNRGVAVDLTIVDKNGRELNMGTPFDYFGKEAHSNYSHLPDSILANRRLLKKTMYRAGFKPIRTEWWHYSWLIKKYPISDMLWHCDETE